MKTTKGNMDFEQGFEDWWRQQPIYKVVVPHLSLIQQSYKDLCLQAWIASRKAYIGDTSEGSEKLVYIPSKIKPQDFSTDSRGL